MSKQKCVNFENIDLDEQQQLYLNLKYADITSYFTNEGWTLYTWGMFNEEEKSLNWKDMKSIAFCDVKKNCLDVSNINEKITLKFDIYDIEAKLDSDGININVWKERNNIKSIGKKWNDIKNLNCNLR